MAASADFSLYREVHTRLTPSNIWMTSMARPDSLPVMKVVAKLLCRPPELDLSPQCEKCSQPFGDRLYHLTFECANNNRHSKWNVYSNTLRNIDENTQLICERLLTSDPGKLLKYMFGLLDDQIVNYSRNTHVLFMIASAHFLTEMYF